MFFTKTLVGSRKCGLGRTYFFGGIGLDCQGPSSWIWKITYFSKLLVENAILAKIQILRKMVRTFRSFCQFGKNSSSFAKFVFANQTVFEVVTNFVDVVTIGNVLIPLTDYMQTNWIPQAANILKNLTESHDPENPIFCQNSLFLVFCRHANEKKSPKLNHWGSSTNCKFFASFLQSHGQLSKNKSNNFFIFSFVQRTN